MELLHTPGTSNGLTLRDWMGAEVLVRGDLVALRRRRKVHRFLETGEVDPASEQLGGWQRCAPCPSTWRLHVIPSTPWDHNLEGHDALQTRNPRLQSNTCCH
jgi:hypothetical protein